MKEVYKKLNFQYKQTLTDIRNGTNQSKIEALKETYKATTNEELLMALKPHPISVTLAQAAMESSWGTSRFFKEANNLFGVWSFNKNEPRIAASGQRGDKTIWLKKYNSIQESVSDYYKNLGRSFAFKAFRQEKMLSNNPYVLVKKLDKYSEKGAKYGEELTSMMAYNKFLKYDETFFERPPKVEITPKVIVQEENIVVDNSNTEVNLPLVLEEPQNEKMKDVDPKQAEEMENTQEITNKPMTTIIEKITTTQNEELSTPNKEIKNNIELSKEKEG